ncbi:leucine-rich repeat and IQ domain-containing protein 3 isoform X1 [Cricetulus griseus]|uniref:Leucine-rich repeat and IQ domain-containing protein 3 n=1 Tax=Cricetulus griseus TaxID=10029 RepID=G3HJU3_CRIGR|nr:leucine-rich repeat and IQ domain-containing protein 3 isoform X1 [Cricetulus griseus]XP_035312754.1 leucine-rich repeat and IQ domain-containing protein 3 isoform X1 [Cricetulus griseus]EGW05984.1 Leucine-rich repeat and IQ domain-containing protein 3 [Cricetulus griseus]
MFHGTITKELTSHEEWNHYNENIIENKKDFVFVKYNGLHLKSMENLQSCISLKVCIFSNNFITDIQPLQCCIKLIKLDLHGNQIKILPDRNFWIGLKNLKLLYLHDNSFCKLKNICVLAACASLIGLTMFDCPVSLKKGYRHVLVNSIWPLKALDHHVISDEEIIQNWHLPERFKAFNPRLFFKFCPALIKGSTYEDEINNIKHVISRINEILAHNSPVLIIQRWIRGFIVRKRLSPYFTHKRHHEKMIRVLETKWICIGRRSEDKILDDIFLFKPNINGKVAHWKQMRCTPADFKHSADYRKHISCLSYELKSKDIDRKPQTPSHPIQKGQKESKADSEDEEMDISFRVSTLKIPLYSSPSLKYGSVLKEMKPDYFSDYLQPIPGTHPKPPIKRETLEELKKRKEFLASQRAGMKLFMFNDLDKYHSDRKHQEKQAEKSAVVVLAQAARSRARYSIRESLRKKTILAQKLMERDNEAIQKGLRQIWKEKLAYLEKVRERKTMFLAEKKLNALDHSLVQNTNNERTLLLKGIFQVDKMKKEMEELRQKHLIVVEQWRTEKFKQSMLRHMKEMRAEEIRKRHSEEKFVIDTLIFQKALARLEEAKAKADYIRTNYTSKSYKRA